LKYIKRLEASPENEVVGFARTHTWLFSD